MLPQIQLIQPPLISIKNKKNMEHEEKKEKLEVGPALRLVGMTWVSMLIIYFLPLTVWAIMLKIILGLFVLVVIRGSFQPIWDRYETMGAFVTMQAVWVAGLFWISPFFHPLQYIFIFLIVLGMATKFKQIKHINSGLGSSLNPNLQRPNNN